MLKKFRKSNEKGFTLIELLIVVAIIGILAAIAIPQFAAYRQRAFGSAALSDLRNSATGQEALFADTQGYGSVASGVLAVGNSVAAAAVLAAGPLEAATTDVASTGAFLLNPRGTHAFSVSNGVVVGGSATVDGNNIAQTYILMSKHTQSDAAYGRDSDSSATYRASHVAATALAVGDIPASAATTIELTGDTGAATAWTQM